MARTAQIEGVAVRGDLVAFDTVSLELPARFSLASATEYLLALTGEKAPPVERAVVAILTGMFSLRRVALILLLVLGFVGVAVPAQADATRPAVSIARARALPLGTVVTVAGSATTPSGAFESSFFDKGFALQDRSAGIYVSFGTDLGIAPRTQVRVTGTLTDSFGLLILVPDNAGAVQVHGKGPKVRAERQATGAIGEATEGRLVRVVGRITQAPASDLPFGFKFFVNDGSGELQIFVNTQTNIDLTGLAVGRLVSVTGFSSQFDTHYEIDPRFQADIVTQ